MNLSIFKRLLLDKNNKEVSRNVILTILIKGCAMLISVFTVPAYTRYFDNDTAYGAWLTIAAVFTWINMFDLGIGNGLRNYLVKSIAEKDKTASKRLVSAAYVSIGIISSIILFIFVLVSFFIDWNTILKVSKELISEGVFRSFIIIVFCGVVIHFFFLLINSVFYAIQRTFWPSLLALITQSLILVYILIPNHGSLENRMTELSYVYVFAYDIPYIIATLYIFLGKYKEIKPDLKFFDSSIAKKILGLGGAFFIIQIALIALNSSNELYINAFFSSEDVVQYNYYHRLFYIITVFVSLLSQPIWSAITKAYYEKRYSWILKTWKVLTSIAIFCAIVSVLLACLYQPIANIWLGKGKLIVSFWPVFLFAVVTIQITIINLANSISNGVGKLKYQAIFTGIGAILKLVLVFALHTIINSWIVVILATVIASIPLMIVQPIYIFSFISKLNKSESGQV